VAPKVVFWDFEGTLAARPGIWSRCLLDVLDELVPGHGLTRDDIAPGLRDRFPWHDWRRPHPELADPDAWWDALLPVLAGAYTAAGVPPGDAVRAAAGVRTCYLDPAFWTVYVDVLPALDALRAAGWRHAIVSNHAPELPALVRSLFPDGLFDVVLTSAATGYEKPHPRMYEVALAAAGRPAAVWMVGDNPEADVRGAEASAIPAILVRAPDETVADGMRRAADAQGAARIILGGDVR
jgi:putative hydrolase of the HAD superfamily